MPMSGVHSNGAVLMLTVVAIVVPTSASLLHGTSEKADIQAHQELRHGAAELALGLRGAKAQSQQNPEDYHFIDKEDYRRWRYSPRMFVAEGCDGSTAIMNHAFKILELHGIYTEDPRSQKELLDPSRNPYYTPSSNDVVMAMKSMHGDLMQKKKTLVFKSILHRDAQATLNRSLKDMGTYVVYNTRRNTLNHLVCMIRDCFLDTSQTSTYGYPVDSHGNPSGACFDRRPLISPGSEKDGEGGSSDESAYLKISTLGDNLVFFEEQARRGMQMLKEAGYDAAHTATEDMIAFEEGGANRINRSYEAWKVLLQSWGIVPDVNKLWYYLQSGAGTWKPEPQASSLFNPEEVHAELKRLGREDLIDGAA